MSWLGIKIKNLAKEKNISLLKLAEEVGVSRQTVNDWIRGQIPKGNHLLSIAEILRVSPNDFFDMKQNDDILIPVHRKRKGAKINQEVQKETIDLVNEYKLFFKSVINIPIVPVIRTSISNLDSAKMIAADLRNKLNLINISTINYEQTFRLLNMLGIHIVFQKFPETIKSYAFYTRIFNNRVVFVNSRTNILDLIFPLLHEAVHAVRDENNNVELYEQDEEFCDLTASYIQFTDEYIKLVYETISNLSKSAQINKLKNFGAEFSHSLFGVVKRIKALNAGFSLDVGGADTNLKKDFLTIGEILNRNGNEYDYLNVLSKLSPLFVTAIYEQLENISDRKLAFLLCTEGNYDIYEIRKELPKLVK